MEIDFRTIRGQSLATAQSLGYPTNPHLPLLSDVNHTKSVDEIVDRSLILYALLCGLVGGYPRDLLWNWLTKEGLSNAVTEGEKCYFLGNLADQVRLDEMELQVEAVWALLWAIRKVDRLDPGDYVANTMNSLLPAIEKLESSHQFRATSALRYDTELVEECDLLYCMHWGFVHGQLNNIKLSVAVEPYVVMERRHALEWILSDSSWDDVPLDT